MEITNRNYLDIAINFEQDIFKLNLNWERCRCVK